MRRKRTIFLSALLCLCLCLTLSQLRPPEAEAESYIVKVLATTSYTPVALMEADEITAATSTNGIYLYEYGWYEASSGNPVNGKFGVRPVSVLMTFATHDGYEFDSTVAVYLNNSPASYEVSPDRHYLTLTRTYDPMIWKPSVIKNPGDEYVNEGGLASFVASASYTEGFQWYAHNPETGEVQSIYEIPNAIEIFSDGEQSRLNIYAVPAWMDGWEIYCSFVGALGSTSLSTPATIHVKALDPALYDIYAQNVPQAAETPEPTPEPTPSPTPSPEPSAEPTPSPTPEPTAPPIHVHEFPETFRFDEQRHWRECSCGERIEQGAHTFVWEVQEPAARDHAGTERGVCSACGYEVTRELPYTGPSDLVRFGTIGIGGLVGLTVAVLIVDSIRSAVRRKNKK